MKDESKHRNYIGNWLRERAHGKYSVPQEEELANAKRPAIRIHNPQIDAPVPIELKVADQRHWTGPKLFERLENQLCGDYLRDPRSTCGVFLLIFRGEKEHWITDRRPDEKLGFQELVAELQLFANEILSRDVKIEAVKVLGIDLTRRQE